MRAGSLLRYGPSSAFPCPPQAAAHDHTSSPPLNLRPAYFSGFGSGISPSLLQRITKCRGSTSGAVLSGVSRRLIVTDAALAVFEPEAVPVHLEDVNVVG